MTRQRWIIVGAVLVGILLLISEHSNTSTTGNNGTSGTSGARPCTMTVTADSLNVLSNPDNNASVVDTFTKGAVVSADSTTSNGFRQLGPDRWAAQQYLVPAPGADCG